MVYAFKKTDENSTTLGISDLPYQVGGYPQIDGLSNGKNYPLSKPGKFPYCVSLNSISVRKGNSKKNLGLLQIRIIRDIPTIQPTRMLRWLMNWDILWGSSTVSQKRL